MTTETVRNPASIVQGCTEFAKQQFARELTLDELRLLSSTIDYVLCGGDESYSSEGAAFQPGKRLGTRDRAIVELVVRFLGQTPALSESEKQRRAHVARAAFTVD